MSITSSMDIQLFLLCLQLDGKPIFSLKTMAMRQIIKNRLGFPSRLPQLPAISRRNWSLFYITSMQYSARNLWYKLIFDKVSSKTNLQRIIPQQVLDGFCQYCLMSEKNRVYAVYLWSQGWCLELRACWSSCTWDNQLPIFGMLGSIMHAIWVTHRNDHFRRVSFTSSTACNMTKKSLLNLQNYSSMPF